MIFFCHSCSHCVPSCAADEEGTIVMTTLELSWFTSVFALGALVGGLVSGPMQNLLGRRGALLASALPSLLGWCMTGELS